MTNNKKYDDNNNEGREELEQGIRLKDTPKVSVLHPPGYEVAAQTNLSSGGPTLAETGTETPASHGTDAKDRDPLIQLGTESNVAGKRYRHIHVPGFNRMED